MTKTAKSTKTRSTKTSKSSVSLHRTSADVHYDDSEDDDENEWIEEDQPVEVKTAAVADLKKQTEPPPIESAPQPTPSDPHHAEIAARRSLNIPIHDTGARNDHAHAVRHLLDQCRHPITRVLVGVSK